MCACAGDSATYRQPFMHEVGHNLWLRHAGRNGAEYADDTSVMGYCCATRCHNAAHAWLLGWSDEVGRMRLDAMLRGVAVRFRLPVQNGAGGGVLVVDPGSLQLNDTTSGEALHAIPIYHRSCMNPSNS